MAPKKKSNVVVKRTTRSTVKETVQVTVFEDGASESLESLEKITEQRSDPCEIVTPVKDIIFEKNTTEEHGQDQIIQELTPPEEDQEELEEQKKVKEEPQKQAKKRKPHEKAKEEATKTEKRGRKRKRVTGGGGYKVYVYRVLKQVHPELGISSKAMMVVNNFMSDMFEKLAGEVRTLLRKTGKRTMTAREVQGAVRLVLPGELGNHAVSEGVKAISNYMDNV